MTDRHAGYVVILEEDMRADDAEQTLAALRMVRGVLSVEPVLGDIASQLYANREKMRFLKAVYAALDEIAKGGANDKLKAKLP